MEKIIIVHYVPIGNFTPQKVRELLAEYVRVMTPKEEENILTYFVPMKHDSTPRVECINPRLVSEELFEEARKTLERANLAINDFLQASKNETN